LKTLKLLLYKFYFDKAEQLPMGIYLFICILDKYYIIFLIVFSCFVVRIIHVIHDILQNYIIYMQHVNNSIFHKKNEIHT